MEVNCAIFLPARYRELQRLPTQRLSMGSVGLGARTEKLKMRAIDED